MLKLAPFVVGLAPSVFFYLTLVPEVGVVLSVIGVVFMYLTCFIPMEAGSSLYRAGKHNKGMLMLVASVVNLTIFAITIAIWGDISSPIAYNFGIASPYVWGIVFLSDHYRQEMSYG